MNILVTGAKGQLGQELQYLPQTEGADYLFTDIETLDITRFDAVERFVAEHKIEVIINCAAYTDVGRAEQECDKAEQINVRAVENLSTIAKNHDITLVHISTDYVFGGNSNKPYTEEMTTAPTNVYGRTKRDGEQAIIQSGCKYIIIRTSWLYSSYGENFVKKILRLSQEKDTINVVFDQVGTPTYAGDLALVIKMIAESELLNKQGIYHFSNEGAISWYDFAKAIVELSGGRCNVIPCKSTDIESLVSRPAYSVLDKSKIKATLGMSIPYWKDSLKECLYRING